MFEKIKLWFKFEGQYYHRDFIKGIKNLIRWFSTIWKDRDWDDHYIWELLSQKLKFQAEYIGDRDFHVRAKRDTEIMLTCVRLIEKIKDEYYGIEYMDYHEIKVTFEPTILSNGEKGYEYKSNIISEKFDEYFAKYPKVYKKVLKENPDGNKNIIAFYMSIENHKRAKRLLFKLLENNIENWWD